METYSEPTHSDPSTSEQMAMASSSPPSTDADLEDKTKSPKTDNVEVVTGARLLLMLASLSLACFLILLDTSIVSTAIPKITDHFHSLPDVGWYGSAYQLGSSVLQPLTGKIYNHFSLKWTFIAFFAIFELGSAICGAAQSSAMLIVGRAVSGVGASALINGAFTIVSSSVPLEKQPRNAVAQLGVAIGPLVGGAFTHGYTWRWCFYINLPLGALVAFPLILMHIPEQVPKESPGSALRKVHHHLDLVGFALFAPAVIQLLLALQFGGNQFAWNSSQVIGLFCGAGATFIVWLVWNYHKGDDGLLPVPTIRRRAVWMSGLNYTFLMSTLFGASYFLPIYFQAVKGVNAIMSGVYLLATILPQLVGAVLSGTLISKIGYIPPISIFAATLTSIGSGLYAMLQPGTSTAKWVGYQVLTGFGRGTGFTTPVTAVQHAVSKTELSSALAFIVWCQYIGPAIFLSLYNTIFDTSLRPQLREHAPNTNANAIIMAGATEFRRIVHAQDLPGVLVAFSNSLDRVFYLVAAAGVVAWFAAWGMGWKDIRKTKEESPADSTANIDEEKDQHDTDNRV
ncbi:hypothetical protein A1O3_04876 [Capronia epimyces CBS 606.96]|uniref:Major facilitator superfamily (MFS) profile domain-containing protein n=1 Tax=Capronia epimyces CBS 606.96 TaxID=1182542 RepID=W9YPL4_9EURO|nr:uncharacterized protein A1O3_04876 [Capronia epimyces CBS 606.96]EXJ84209.1 hypothetical protein A1O3_04876 [Capronia epimyces CBS 606.96]